MRIYNPTYKKIAINWDSVELPVNEGTPFSADGTIANTSDAIGLLPVYIWKKPIDEEVYILIGGDVYQSEVEEAFGAELTDDAIASMGGINFYEADGTIDKASGGGGGESPLIECHFDGGAITDMTWKEIDTAVKSGKIPYFIYSQLFDGVNVAAVYYCYNSVEVQNNTPHLYSTLFMSGSLVDGGFEPYPFYFIANSEDDHPFLD